MANEASAFKAGDWVKVKELRGPGMIVKQVGADDGNVRCWWFSKNDELQDRVFNPGDLRPVGGDASGGTGSD